MRGGAILLPLLAVAASACRATGGGAELRERLTLEFRGAESYSENRLADVAAEEIVRDEEERITHADVDDAAFALAVFYRDEGFPFVRIDYDYEEAPGGRPRAVFHVAEGVRSELEELSVSGNETFDDDELEGILEEPEDEPFVEAELDGVRRALERFYWRQGFLDVEVGEPAVEFSLDGTAARATIPLAEGLRYRVTETEVEGAPEELAESAAQIARERQGEVYTPRLAQEVRAALLELHARHARPDTKVTAHPELDRMSGAVRLSFEIEPGERVRIGRIEVIGNERTRERLIRSYLPFEPGDAYDSEEVQEGFRELFATGLFESIRLELAPGPAETRTLLVVVEELPTLELRVEPGWGSYEGPRLEIGVEEMNLLGTGRRLDLETAVSPLAQSAQLALIEPRLFGSRFLGEVSVFGRQREEPAFTERELGTGLHLRRRFGEDLDTIFGYRFRSTDLEDVDVNLSEDQLPEEFRDNVNLGSLVLSLTKDDDDLLVVSRGRAWRLQLEWASALFASEADFVHVGAGVSREWSLGEDTSLAVLASSAVVIPVGDTEELPLQVRLFNGGENTVRSFTEDELGPRDAGGEPTGGQGRTVLSLELRERIVGNLSGALFADAGNVVIDYEDYFEFPGFRPGVGIGLRYLLPIGPLRLDLGWNPAAQDDEDDLVLHFSLGLPY